MENDWNFWKIFRKIEKENKKLWKILREGNGVKEWSDKVFEKGERKWGMRGSVELGVCGKSRRREV